MIASGVVAAGSRVSSNASGLAQVASSGHHVLGRAITAAAAANEVISVLLLKDGTV